MKDDVRNVAEGDNDVICYYSLISVADAML